MMKEGRFHFEDLGGGCLTLVTLHTTRANRSTPSFLTIYLFIYFPHRELRTAEQGGEKDLYIYINIVNLMEGKKKDGEKERIFFFFFYTALPE